MKSKGTWILLGLVVVLGLYAYWDFDKEKKEKKREEEMAIFIPYPVDQVSEVYIEHKASKLKLVKDVDGWKLTEPIVDLADSPYTDDFVNSLTRERNIGVASEGEALDWKIFGLSDPQSKITVTNNAKQSTVLEFSEKRNFEGNPLMRKAGENKVYVGSAAWTGWLEKIPLQFRDKRFLRERIANIEGIEISNRHGQVKLHQKETTWFYSADESVKLDQNRVREILSQVSNAQAEDFLAEKKITEADRKKYELNKPKVKVKFKIKDKYWTAALSQILKPDQNKNLNPEKLVYAEVSEPVFILKISNTVFEKLDGVTISSLRNKKIPFEFNAELAKKIEGQSPLKKFALVKNGELWEMSPVQDNMEIQQDKVKALIDGIKAMSVSDYIPKSEQGRFKAQSHIQIKDSDGKVVYELAWGSLFKKKDGNKENSFYLAKSNASAEVFVMEAGALDGLPVKELVKEKAAPKDTEAEKDKVKK